MDIEKKEIHIVPPHRIQQAASFAIVVLGVFLVVLTVNALKENRFIGSGVTATNTITVSGEGKVFAVPDTATFTVTVQEEGKDVKSAQDAATKKSNAIVAYLKSTGIEDKDVQTTDYSVNPQYDYGSTACPQYGYCPPTRQNLKGYQVSQTLTVKVRNTDKAGDILSGVGSKGAFQVSGLSFTIDDQTALEAEARTKAIDDARAKAQELARELGVSLMRVVGFNENGNVPIYYAKTMSADSGVGMGGAPTLAPEIPTGQNQINSNVSVTYEIR